MLMLRENRNKLIDFPYPWIKSVASLMIPNPAMKYDKSEINRSTILRVKSVQFTNLSRFQFPRSFYYFSTSGPINKFVYLCQMFESIWAFLYWLQCQVFTDLRLCISYPRHQSNDSERGEKTPRRNSRERRRLIHAIDFIFANILLQRKSKYCVKRQGTFVLFCNILQLVIQLNRE